MVECYARPVQERFIASRWSLAYLFRVCYYIALAVAPIYIAYSSGGFWRRSDTYIEQPAVQFTKSLIAVGYAADGTRVLQYSTIERFNYLIGYENIRQPSVKSWSTDVNLDGKADTWDINLVFPMRSGDAPIVSMSLVLFFQVGLSSLVSLDMNALVALQGGTGVAGNKWIVAGDLELFQRNPLARTAGLSQRAQYRYPLLNDSTIISIEDCDLGDLMLRNEARNGQGCETLHVTARSVWSRSSASSFNVSAHFTVPPQEVSYVPGASEAIKFAWIQWLACFWILYFGLKFVRDFVYDQNIVESRRVIDGTPLGKLHQF